MCDSSVRPHSHGGFQCQKHTNCTLKSTSKTPHYIFPTWILQSAGRKTCHVKPQWQTECSLAPLNGADPHWRRNPPKFSVNINPPLQFKPKPENDLVRRKSPFPFFLKQLLALEFVGAYLRRQCGKSLI